MTDSILNFLSVTYIQLTQQLPTKHLEIIVSIKTQSKYYTCILTGQKATVGLENFPL